MITIVDPPGGWAFGFPAPLQGDYEKQLREAGYPEVDIPLALEHSWYWQMPEESAALDALLASDGEEWLGIGSDGDDGA